MRFKELAGSMICGKKYVPCFNVVLSNTGKSVYFGDSEAEANRQASIARGMGWRVSISAVWGEELYPVIVVGKPITYPCGNRLVSGVVIAQGDGVYIVAVNESDRRHPWPCQDEYLPAVVSVMNGRRVVVG